MTLETRMFNSPSLTAVKNLLENVRDARVVQIFGEPDFSVQKALNFSVATDCVFKTQNFLNDHPCNSVFQSVYHTGSFQKQPFSSTASSEKIAKIFNHSICEAERGLTFFIQSIHQWMQTAPLLLVQSRLSIHSENHVNTWGLSSPSCVTDIGSYVLRKTFAEAYASFGVLVSSEGAEGAYTAVRSLMARNSVLHTVWGGENDIWHHHIGPNVLQTVLDGWKQWADFSAVEARQWVERVCGEAFGRWLNAQPLAEIVVSELIPSFEKRVIDCMNGGDSFFNTIPKDSPIYSPLKMVQDLSLAGISHNTHRVVVHLQEVIQRTADAMDCIQRSPNLLDIKNMFESERLQVCARIFSELTTTAPPSTLRARLEHYRKPPPPEPPSVYSSSL